MESDPAYFDCFADSAIGNSSLQWSMRDYQPDSYMFAKVDEDKVKQNVLSSQSVACAIEKVCFLKLKKLV